MSSLNNFGTINTNHPRSEVILVASGNQALVTTGNITPATGNAIPIASGQLGVINAASGAFLAAGQTTTVAPQIKIVQGTPNSANIKNQGAQQFRDRKYVESNVINSNFATAFSSRVCFGGIYSSWAIGDLAANSGAVSIVDDAEYRLHITFDGVRQNRYFGTSGYDGIHPSFVSPDFTTLSATYTTPRDFLIQRSAYGVNLNSKIVDHVPNFYGGVRPIVAFAINSAGGTGTSLTTISAAAIGTTVDFIVKDGITYSFTVDQAFKNTVNAWIASGSNNLTGASTIEVINIATAGTASGLGTDVLMLMGIDEELPAARNDLKPVKVRLRVGAEGNFNSPALAINELTYGQEIEGSAENWFIEYDMLAAHQIHSQQKWRNNYSDLVPPEYITAGTNYTSYIIYHYDKKHGFMSQTEQLPHKTIILVECDLATGTGAATTVASLNAVLAPWLNSTTVETTTVSPIAF